MKKIAIVAPAYNEAAALPRFYDVLTAELAKLPEYDFSILFVDDGSRDGTFAVLESIAAHDPRVQALSFSRNFGHQAALLAGIDHAEGVDAVITMDSDLQHPPAKLRDLLAKYEEGNDIVYTIRAASGDVPLLRKLLGKLFYRGVNAISEVEIRENASDFRLISGRVAELIRMRIRERNLFLRGIISWIGFRQAGITFTADPRVAGHSKYSLKRLIEFALFGAISFSRKPLRAAIFAGMVVAFFGVCFTLYVLGAYLIEGTTFPAGWATLAILLALFGGAQLFFLGVIGEYIGGIFDEVKARPHYIVATAINVAPR